MRKRRLSVRLRGRAACLLWWSRSAGFVPCIACWHVRGGPVAVPIVAQACRTSEAATPGRFVPAGATRLIVGAHSGGAGGSRERGGVVGCVRGNRCGSPWGRSSVIVEVLPGNCVKITKQIVFSAWRIWDRVVGRRALDQT